MSLCSLIIYFATVKLLYASFPSYYLALSGPEERRQAILLLLNLFLQCAKYDLSFISAWMSQCTDYMHL